MSLLDILSGAKPLLKPSLAQRMKTIDQDYALLASRGGGPFYLNDQCGTPRYRRDLGPGFEDVAAPRNTICEEALDALMTDRNKLQTDIGFVTIIVNPLGGAIGDLPVNFPFPARKIWVASKTAAMSNNALYMSLDPVGIFPGGRNPGGNSVIPTGSEHWFDLTYTAQAGASVATLGKLITFKTPIRSIYLTIGFENGGGADTIITLGIANEELVDISGTAIGIATS